MAIRVLNLFTILDRGGAETMCMNLYRHIDREQVQFDFLVYHKERGQYEDEIERLGGRIYRIPPINPKSIIAHIRGARMFFRDHPEYQVVHDHMGSNGAFVLWAAKQANVKTRIYHSHGDKQSLITNSIKETFRRLVYKTLWIIAKRCSNYYFACGIRAAAVFDRREEVYILANAIDAEEFRYNKVVRERKRQELNCNNKLIVGQVGRLDQNKNQKFSISILQCALQKRKEIELWLIGDGIQKSSLMELAKRLGIQEYVRFFGVRTDVSELLQAMDAFIFTSFSEGLPVSCIEAQAAGLPCVFSNGFDPSTIIVDDNCRVLSLSESPERWADAIIEMSSRVRQDTIAAIREKGYDIKQTSEYMQKFYLSKS